MMYTPDAFSGRLAALPELLAAHPFATLITPQTDGEPWISHLVLLADPEQPDCLLGHLARANPHSQALLRGRSVALFHGEHGYVSPAWYAAGGAQVPTWNYRVAHAHGVAEEMEGGGPAAAAGTAGAPVRRRIRLAVAKRKRGHPGDAARHRRFPATGGALGSQGKTEPEPQRGGPRRRGRGAGTHRGDDGALARAMRAARRD